jgi:drug/metabolite transporter (DMT)-like permease
MKKSARVAGFTFLSLLWGTTWLAIKFSLQGFPPFFGAALRFALATVILYLYMLWKKIPLRVSKREFWFLLLTAFLIYFIDYGFIYWGEQYLNPGVTAIFFATFPLFTAIFANFLFKSETFSWSKTSGLLLGFVGIFVVFYDQLLRTQFNDKIILASAAVIISGASGALSTVMIKKYLSHMRTITLTVMQLIWGTLFLGIYSILGENLADIAWSPKAWAAVFYLGVLGSAVAFLVFYKLLQHMGAITLSLIIYITPIVAILVDYIIFGQFLSPQAILGTSIIFIGIWITQLRKEGSKNSKPHRRQKF